MNKTEIKNRLINKIKFGQSKGRCAIGNYLFEDALPFTDQPYQDVSSFKSEDFMCASYETFENAAPTIKSFQYKKEQWYIKNDLGWVQKFYLWKRIS